MAEVQDKILTLSPLEHCRARPGVYAGDTSNSNQLVLEVFANALDCYNAGFGDRINISVNNGVVQCEDCGQGFNVNEVREDGMTTLEASFSAMNTSGKFSDDGLYQGTSLGLNGMGAKICTFLSHWLEVVTFKNNRSEHLWFKEGVLQKREVLDYDHEVHTGTTVTFKPSEEFFDNPNPDTKFLSNFFNDIACLCPGLTVCFNNEVIKHDGIQDLLQRKVGKAIEIVNSQVIFNETVENQSLNLGMTFTSNSSSSITPYVNCGNTDTGPHITAMKSTITRAFNAWAKENGVLKANEKNLEGSSIQEGLVLVCNITSSTAAYNAQVKTTVTKIDTGFITQVLSKQLELWLDNNPDDAKNVIEKALTARKAAEAAKKARARVKAQASEKKDKVFKLPTTLTDCYGKDRNKCELVICEGKSAASGLVAARDSEFQAVYGVRGKMLSVLKSTPEKILANTEINNIIQALGLDYNPKTAKMVYDKDKLRYGKIIAAADADPDGQAIENLLFNILWYLCPDLIIEGHVYSAVPPLFRVTTKKNEYVYLKDGGALEEYQKAHGADVKSISRNKGLGEQSSDELSDTLLAPETRHVVQLQVSDIGATDNLFNDLYGKKVEPRVKFLLEHSEEGEYDYS